MSWLCLFTLSCLANPAAPMSLLIPPEPEVIEAAIPVASHVRPGRLSKSPGSARLSCELREVRRDGAQIVLAVVHAAAPVEGEYEFSVGARGRNTVSSSTEDAFQVRAGERLELEGPSLSLGRGAALTSQLELRDTRGQILTTCRL